MYNEFFAKAHEFVSDGLPTALQQRYNELTAKLEAGTITSQERQELLELIDQVELADARRMKYLIELAQLRNMSLDELMNQLDIHHPSAYG